MTKVLNMAGEAGDRRWAIFERFIAQGLVKGQFPILDEVEMEELTDHQDYGPGYPPGRNGVRALTSALLQAFPDMQSDIEEIVFAKDESWARIRSYGTFNGPYLGIPPNGSPISIYVVEFGSLDRRRSDHGTLGRRGPVQPAGPDGHDRPAVRAGLVTPGGRSAVERLGACQRAGSGGRERRQRLASHPKDRS